MKNQSWWDLKRCNASKECVGKLLFGHKKPLFHLVEASCTVKNLKDEELHSLLFTSISLSLFFLGCFIVSLTACKGPGFSEWYHKLHSLLLYYVYYIRGFCFKKSQLGVASYHQQATNYVKSFLAIDVRLSDFCFNHISLSCVQKGNEWVSGSTILRSKDAIL